MPYDYATERAAIFTEDGQRMFLQIRDSAQKLLSVAGAARFQEITAKVAGDSWKMLACVDRLVELGELRELTDKDTMGQYRVFIKMWD